MNSHRRQTIFVVSLLTCAFFVALATITLAATKNAPDITRVDPPSLTITVGNTDKVTITSSEPIASSDAVVWSDLGDIIEVVKTEVSGNTALTTLRVLKFSPTPKEVKVSVSSGAPKTVTITTLTVVKATDFPAEPGRAPTIKQGERLNIPLKNLEGVTVRDEALEVTSADESVVIGRRKDKTIILEGIKPGTSPVRVTLKSNGQEIKTYDVTVTEALDRIESDVTGVDLTEGETYDLSNLHVKVVGKSNGDLTATNEFKPRFFSTKPDLADVDAAGARLTAKRAPKDNEEPPRLVIQPGGNSARAISIPIRITPAASRLNLTAQGNTVFVGKSATFTAEAINSQGERIPDAQVDWDIPDAGDQEALAIMNARGTQVTVQGLAPKEGAKLVGTLRGAPGVPPINLFLNVKSVDVVGFAPLAIRVDLLDSQTARDLFGKKAEEEFFIAKIRLFNKLKNQNGETGDSILVYSESLELRVQLEWKNKDGGSVWTPLPEKAPDGQVSYESLFGKPSVFPELPGEPKCQETLQPNFVARYRPYTFDIVANTHDRRDERSTRTRILTFANGISSFASFVTSIAVPAPGNDLRLGLDQFKGLLIPSFEKLFPSLKEVQRQNIISMVMRPLEEIPFGSDVTRILFIPKGKLYGMAAGKIFRIGGVSTTGACAEVGIIKKTGSIAQ